MGLRFFLGGFYVPSGCAAPHGLKVPWHRAGGLSAVASAKAGQPARRSVRLSGCILRVDGYVVQGQSERTAKVVTHVELQAYSLAKSCQDWEDRRIYASNFLCHFHSLRSRKMFHFH